MPPSTGADRYTRVETFLDNVERVEEPMKLDEPFRSLWLRVHGEMPTLMSEDDMRHAISQDFATSSLAGIEVESSEGLELEGGGRGSSIEVVSPEDVGPTVEMKIDDKKVKFRAAGEEDIRSLKKKEDAAQKVVEIQRKTSTLKGVGGEAQKVIENVRDMAVSYRDGDYERVISKAEEINEKMDSKDLKSSIIVQLQKKISDYEEIGADLFAAKEKFKELATSLKEDRDDFYSLTQSTNRLAEDAIKDIVSFEEVELAEDDGIKEEKAPPEPPRQKKPKVIRKTLKKKPGLPEGTGEEQGGPETEQEEEGPKPVIKIVKKKVVKVAMDEEDEEEDFSIDLDEEEAEEDIGSVEPGREEEPTEDQENAPIREEGTQPEETPEAQQEGSDPGPQQNVPPQEAASGSGEEIPEPVGPSQEDIENAFKQYQFVYNASVKLDQAGKDVTQIFDLYSYGEEARKKGDMKTYVGVAKQLQDMLIALQK
ncbi:MAG: hypothetical protein R6V01_00590 [Thermoplasmatota archaeon]